MPLSLASLLVHIGVDKKDAESGLKSVGGTFQATAAVATGGLGLITAGVGLVVESVKGWVNAAEEGQDRAAQLNAVLASTHGVSGLTADGLNKMALQLMQVTKYDDEAWAASQTLMLGFTHIGKDVFPQAEMAAANMAARLGMDLTSATRRVGMALENPIVGMGRLRQMQIVLTDEQKNSIKTFQEQGNMAAAQGVILDAMTQKFGGAAEVAGKTFSGSLVILQNNLSNLKEALGSAFLPALGSIVGAITPIVAQMGDKLQPMMDGFGKTLSGIASTVIPMVGQGFSFFLDILKFLGPVIDNVVKPIMAFKLQADSLNPVMTIAKDVLAQLGTAFQQIWPSIQALLPAFMSLGKTISDLLVGGVSAMLPALLQLAQVAIAQFVPAMRTILDVVQQLLPPIISLATNIGLQLVSAVTAILPLAMTFAQTLITALMPAAKAIVDVASALFPVLITVATTIISALLPALTSIVKAAAPVIAIVASFVSQLATDLAPVIELIGEIIAAVLPPILAIVGKKFHDLLAVVSFVMPYIQQVVSIAINTVKTILSTVMALISGDWSGAWNALVGGMSGVWNQITGGVNSALTGILNKVGGWGKSILDGLVSGVRGAWNSFTRDLGNIIGGIPKLVKNLLGIASPSKVFMEIGANMRLGLLQGFAGDGAVTMPLIAPALGLVSGGGRAIGLTRPNSFAGAVGGGGGGGTTYTINVTTQNEAAIAQAIVREQQWQRMLHS